MYILGFYAKKVLLMGVNDKRSSETLSATNDIYQNHTIFQSENLFGA